MRALESLSRAPRLEYVDPIDLSGPWKMMRPILDRHVTENHPDWMAEDIYTDLKLGKSQLFLGRGGKDGFAIVATTGDSAGSIFWIWFVYGPGQGAAYWDQIMEMARTAGCNRIAFSSPLKFWSEHAATYGFKPARTIYELRIS